MAKTTWEDFTLQTEHRRWLLRDGSVLEAERVWEVSGSGRKMRSKRHIELTGFAKDQDALVLRAAQLDAEARGAELWVCLFPERKPLDSASLHLVQPRDEHNSYNTRRPPTRLRFVFRHRDYPIEAHLIIVAEENYNRRQVVSAELIFPSTRRYDIETPSEVSAGADEYADRIPVQLGTQSFDTEQEAAAFLSRQTSAALSMASVEIPDRYIPGMESLLVLDFAESNVGGDFVATLQDFVSSGPALERATAAYEDLRAAMRSLGVVMAPRNADVFAAALAANTKHVLEAPITTVAGETRGRYGGGDHALSLHMATGTFAVTCNIRGDGGVTPEEQSETWELARFEAEMRGELDAFLAYCASLKVEQARKRVQKLVRERDTA